MWFERLRATSECPRPRVPGCNGFPISALDFSPRFVFVLPAKAEMPGVKRESPRLVYLKYWTPIRKSKFIPSTPKRANKKKGGQIFDKSEAVSGILLHAVWMCVMSVLSLHTFKYVSNVTQQA